MNISSQVFMHMQAAVAHDELQVRGMASVSSSSHQAIHQGSSRAGQWKKLLQCTLGEEEGAAVAASLDRRDVIINVDQGTQKSGEPSDSEGVEEEVETLEPESILHVVAAAGDSDANLLCAREIHARDSVLLTTAAPRSTGDTPLHCAARAGNIKMVSLLTELATKGDGGRQQRARDFVRMQNKRGETALHEAVRFRPRTAVKMVETLMNVDKGLASVNAGDGTSPMYLASTFVTSRPKA